ncbi:LysR family transcriptional regulator [Burkholderia cenocepacia]|uniref:LysR family transcriptional regulator n=1 Tax=Burkholderia cenocepacia TaxID=95486 RepID=UPI00196B567C|nr:LysR family transcriptional regulator [Burkholderia cenocepacia]MBN3534282.1 LysR family transcriptional regulator [Burkholderia cenocepacia]MBR8030273.1 LysR family transcriptional regulator [Burkholderia cenocepacia]MBR8174087.1 LysR family transcriptional regulator [Burkholderia cenocepacia]MBR8428796.1 LysR family transcriptional regulator [Burkholderia cenocepacia]MBU9660043.1 LysR family transcriptional regulator [Burkholderia cenocepacia]
MEQFLNDMVLFVEVVKAKGFRSAAQVMDIPNSTLSRRIGALEKAIGLRLLHRTTRRIELTEAGKIYFERCKRIVDEARLAHEQLGEMLAQPSGVLRASLPVDFSVTYLAPLIAEFAARYPSIAFDLDFTPRRVDLISEPFDVAIRMGESESSQLIARPLATLGRYLYASPDYLARSGEPGKPADLEQHECLSILKATSWTLHDGKRKVTVPVSGRFMLNSVGMIRCMGTLGMGIILMTEEVVADEVAQGKLCRVLPRWHGTPISVYAITETRLLPAKTQLFIEFLRDRLG